MTVLVDEHIEITVHSRCSMDHRLDEAVDRMIEAALRRRTHGIQVIRLGDGHFVVALSDAVPFGYTEELDSRTPVLQKVAETVSASPGVPACTPIWEATL